MVEGKKPDIVIQCPCCEATLTVDAFLGKVIAHQPPPKKTAHVPDLDRAASLLREQAERREAIFRQSSEDLKTKSQILERKFATALEKSKDEPVTRPTRDFDLD